MIDYIGRTICFFPLNWLLAFGFLCPCYLLIIESEWTHRKVSFTEQIVDYNIIYHKQERSGCFFMTLLMLTKWLTLGVYRMNLWNDHWTFFVETSISNTLSTVKLIWNFPIRPERKITLRRKKFAPRFSSLNCVVVSVGVLLCYKMTLQGIGRLRKVTIYVFRQVPV